MLLQVPDTRQADWAVTVQTTTRKRQSQQPGHSALLLHFQLFISALNARTVGIRPYTPTQFLKHYNTKAAREPKTG